MIASNAVKEVFRQSGPQAGYQALFSEEVPKLYKNLRDADPEDVKEIHRLQSQIKLFETELPRVWESVEKYIAERAIQPVSTGA